jgi:hypothetical protein
LEEVGLAPFLEAVMDGAWCAEASRYRLPLASGSEDVEYRVHGEPIIHSWAAGLLLGFRLRQERLDSVPELVWDLIRSAYENVSLFQYHSFSSTVSTIADQA